MMDNDHRDFPCKSGNQLFTSRVINCYADKKNVTTNSSSARHLDVPPTVYVPKVSELRQSKSLILQAPHCDKRICDNLKA